MFLLETEQTRAPKFTFYSRTVYLKYKMTHECVSQSTHSHNHWHQSSAKKNATRGKSRLSRHASRGLVTIDDRRNFFKFKRWVFLHLQIFKCFMMENISYYNVTKFIKIHKFMGTWENMIIYEGRQQCTMKNIYKCF